MRWQNGRLGFRESKRSLEPSLLHRATNGGCFCCAFLEVLSASKSSLWSPSSPARSSRASLEILAPRSLISSQLERGTRVGIARASISTSAIGGRTERKAEMDLFQISPSSVLKLQTGDITKWLVNGSTDAIVSSR